MAKRYYGYTQEDVLSHLQNEYQQSKNFVEQKRQLFRERLKDYTNITTDKNKIYVRLIFSVMQTLLALQYADQMTVDFVGRQLWANEVAEQLENLAEFDFEEMEMDKLNYNIEWDRLFFGVGILVFDHWDEVKKHPVYRRVSPLAWIPDLNPDDLEGARYHQFELETSMKELESKDYWNLSSLKKSINEELEETKQEARQFRALTHQTEEKLQIHYCYTHLDGEKYFVVTGGGHQKVLFMEKIEPVFEEEKKDTNNIEFPVFTFHYSPLDYDPYGVNIPDLIADKQRAMQLLMNLEKTKARQAAHGSLFGVDTTKVNINDLTRPTTTTRFVKVKWGDVQNAVVEIPKSRPDQDVQQISQALKQQATLDIGLDERSLWVAGVRNITATENQRIQKNANLKQILNSKVKMWGLKRFWKDWYRRYYENFKWNDKKNIIINTKIGSKPIEIKRKDIVTGYDIDLKVMSKSEQEAEKKDQRQGFAIVLQTILQDPSTPALSRRMAQRKMARLNGATNEEAMLRFPPDANEQIARENVDLLNENRMPSLQDALRDPLTHRVISHRAISTKAKFAYIEALKLLEARLGRQQAQQPVAESGIINQMANAQSQEWQEQQAASLQDITPANE